MMKVIRVSETLEMGAMVGIDPDSDGLARARRLGIPTTAAGVDGLTCSRARDRLQIVDQEALARLGTRSVIAVSAAVLMVRATVPLSFPVVLSVGVAALALGVAIAALYLVTSQAFAAPSRATVLGFAVGIATTLVGGLVLGTTSHGAAGFFALFALACVLVVASAFLMDRHVEPARRSNAVVRRRCGW
jgi:hypothetical protein